MKSVKLVLKNYVLVCPTGLVSHEPEFLARNIYLGGGGGGDGVQYIFFGL